MRLRTVLIVAAALPLAACQRGGGQSRGTAGQPAAGQGTAGEDNPSATGTGSGDTGGFGTTASPSGGGSATDGSGASGSSASSGGQAASSGAATDRIQQPTTNTIVGQVADRHGDTVVVNDTSGHGYIFKLADSTQIVSGGQTVASDQLAVGSRVRVTYHGEQGERVANRLDVLTTSAPAGAATAQPQP